MDKILKILAKLIVILIVIYVIFIFLVFIIIMIFTLLRSDFKHDPKLSPAINHFIDLFEVVPSSDVENKFGSFKFYQNVEGMDTGYCLSFKFDDLKTFEYFLEKHSFTKQPKEGKFFTSDGYCHRVSLPEHNKAKTYNYGRENLKNPWGYTTIEILPDFNVAYARTT